MRDLPPLRLLTTFDAVARSRSMRDAAQALNVSQPAVTQALKALEMHVGAPLLDRSRKPARLTAEGRLLAEAIGEGLDLIGGAIVEIRETTGVDSPRVTVACTLGMATYWLMPRLPEFYRLHPGIVVSVQAPPNDLPRMVGGIDVALRYGNGEWTDGDTTLLFEEVVQPVGQPDLVARLGKQGADLTTAPLIHVRSPQNRNWIGWADYFRAVGVRRADLRGALFDNYVQAVQAAADGRGLMLGWRSISQRLVADGTLTPWSGGEMRPGAGYYVTSGRASHDRPANAAFVNWLMAAAAARTSQDRPPGA